MRQFRKVESLILKLIFNLSKIPTFYFFQGSTPHKSIWYINYLREEFRVKVNLQTGAVLSVSLQKGNFSPPKSYREQFRVETVPVFIGGIRFFIDLEPLSNGNRKILGSFVNPRED